MRVRDQVEKANHIMDLTKEFSDSAREAAAEARHKGGGESHADAMKRLHGRFFHASDDSDSEDSMTEHGDNEVRDVLQEAKAHVHPDDAGKLNSMIENHEDNGSVPGDHWKFKALRAKPD